MQIQKYETVTVALRRRVALALVSVGLLSTTVPVPAIAQQGSGAAAVASISPASTPRISLVEAVALALDVNPELSASRREIAAAAGQIVQSRTRPNPELGYSLEDTQSRTRTQSLQINWPIEMGGKRDARVNVAERNHDVAGADFDTRRADIRASVIAAYFEVLTAEERVALALASEELADKATDVVSKRVLAGKVSPVEETKSRVAGAGLRIESSQATGELRAAKLRLASLLGRDAVDVEVNSSVADAIPLLPSTNALRDRLRASPTIRRAQLEIQRRSAIVSLERSKAMPDITLSLGVKRPNELQRNQILLGISVPLPVFDRNQGNVLEAIQREEKARDELAAVNTKITTEVMQARERLATARDQLDVLVRTILPGAKSAYDAARVGFENGKFSFLDVLDAQRTYFASKSQYIRTVSEAHRADADIDRILGDDAATPTFSGSQVIK